jgi:hypothetical protein
MAEQLADELGMSVWSLKRWSKRYGKDSAVGVGLSGGASPPTADAARLALENARLHREQETVSRQRDILKKPWASWARTRGILRSDHQDENRSILLWHRRNVPGSGSLSTAACTITPKRTRAIGVKRMPSLAEQISLIFHRKLPSLQLPAHPADASA